MIEVALHSTLAFVEGLALIASPCILPILPIFLSSSLSGSKKRPFGIIIGFIFTFALFTLFARKFVQITGIDSNVLRYCSLIILILLGLVMISDKLSEKFSRMTRSFANVGASSSSINDPQGDFKSGLLFGTLIAFVWTPCAGPILAAVIVQTVVQKSSFHSFLVLLFFGLGAGLPMLAIALGGRYLMKKLTFIKEHTEAIRKLLGVIILASVAFMAYQDGFSSSTFGSAKNNKGVYQNSLINGLAKPIAAPEIVGITNWINSDPLTMSQLKGKVVLIDFWTYSCINCVRTLPYIKDWYEKYHDQGLVIIGVHTPEFDFEKNYDNVKNAVEKDGIKYPVALDSNFGTWQSFHNQYWPAQYLIDKNGNVVYEHFGEGEDDATENNIRFLLGLNKITNESASTDEVGVGGGTMTPETYLGYDRADHYFSPESITENSTIEYSFPRVLPANGWALKGSWIITGSNITSASNNAAIKIRFKAKHVYMVLGNSTNKDLKVDLKLNGEPLVNDQGADVKDGSLNVLRHGLYDVVSQSSSTSGILEITATEPGLEVYTFTFGN